MTRRGYLRDMATLIAEDLFLLLLDDQKGTLSGVTSPDPVLGGSLLIELAMAGAVEVAEKTSMWKTARVQAVADSAPDDVLLRAAYDLVAEKPRAAQDLVTRLGKGLQPKLGERLADRGILERRDSKILGVFPRTRWPALDRTREEQVRSAVTAALVQGVQPDDRTGAVVALLNAVDKAHKVVDHEGLSSREVRKRAKEISEGAWAAKAVRDSISAATAAVAAVAVAGAVAASSGG